MLEPGRYFGTRSRLSGWAFFIPARQRLAARVHAGGGS